MKVEKDGFELKEHDPGARYLFMTKVENAGKDKRCVLETCIRKEKE